MYLIIYQIYSCLKDIILDRSALEIFHPRHILDTDRLRTGFSVVHKDPDAYYEEESIVEASPVSTSQTPNEQDRYQRILNLYQTSSSKSSSRSIDDDFDDDFDDDDDDDDEDNEDDDDDDDDDDDEDDNDDDDDEDDDDYDDYDDDDDDDDDYDEDDDDNDMYKNNNIKKIQYRRIINDDEE
jgi:hypothetical protein